MVGGMGGELCESREGRGTGKPCQGLVGSMAAPGRVAAKEREGCSSLQCAEAAARACVEQRQIETGSLERKAGAPLSWKKP